MAIGIVGTGGIGGAIAGHLARAGLELILGNSRGPESLSETVRALGGRTRAATAGEAAQAEVVIVAVPWDRLTPLLGSLGPWNGRILIDPSNPVLPPDFTRIADLGGLTSSEVIAGLVPGARVVKAFNTLEVATLSRKPREGDRRRVIAYSGDDREAKKTVRDLIERMGFAGLDLGSLAQGGKLQQVPDGVFLGLDLLLRDRSASG